MADVEVGAIAPETPVAAPIATTQPDTTADQVDSPEGQQPEAKPERTFTQKELDEIVAKRAAQAERRALKIAREARADAEREFQQRLPKPEQPQAQGRPDVNDPKYQGRPYHEFAADLARWEARQEFDARIREHETQRQQQAAQRQAEAMRERLQEGAAEFEDFEAVALGEHVPISEAMAHAITESDMPAKLAYYLGSHVQEAARIARLPATRQIRELAKIEEKLSAPPKTTSTPPPIVPNDTKAKAETGYRPDMTDKQYAEWRARQKAQKR